jgi:hypothetical protein
MKMEEVGRSLAARLARILGFTALLAFGVSAGAVTGVSMLAAAPMQQVDEPCEEDECEGARPWWRAFQYTETCVDNSPHKTGCNMTGEHECYTYGCYGGGGDDDEDDQN